ncbi:MAG: hypothetical protein PHO53_00505, partial [Actinomycetota bacterium]|nr:hypothetical protein [Actinomycetota bacterium]
MPKMRMIDRVVLTLMPRSWREGKFEGAWSTAEFVEWSYFAVSLHVQVLVGLFYPTIAEEMSSSIGGFAFEFGLSVVLGVVFTYIMLGGHHTMHVLEAAKTYNLEGSLQDSLGQKLVERMPDGTVRFRTNTWTFYKEVAKLFFLGPLGKSPAIIKEGLNYRVNGTPALNVAAAGPKFDRWMARIFGWGGLAMFAASIVMRVTGASMPWALVHLTPKILAIGVIAFFGRYQDNSAMFRYEEKQKAEAELAAKVAAGISVAEVGREEIAARAKANYERLIGEVRNSAVYGGDDPRFKDIAVYLPEGAHNAIQGGKHTEYIDAEGNKGNTSPDLVGQEKWIILFPQETDDPARRGFFGTLQVLPHLQNQIVAEILSREGVSGGGRENEGGCSFNGYGGGDEA